MGNQMAVQSSIRLAIELGNRSHRCGRSEDRRSRCGCESGRYWRRALRPACGRESRRGCGCDSRAVLGCVWRRECRRCCDGVCGCCCGSSVTCGSDGIKPGVCRGVARGRSTALLCRVASHWARRDASRIAGRRRSCRFGADGRRAFGVHMRGESSGLRRAWQVTLPPAFPRGARGTRFRLTVGVGRI